MKIAILKHDDRHGSSDLSAYATYELANKARAEICAKRVDDRAYTADVEVDEDEDEEPDDTGYEPPGGWQGASHYRNPITDPPKRVSVSERVKALFEAGKYDECVEVYLQFNQDESFAIDEVDVQGGAAEAATAARRRGQVPDVLLHYRGSGSDLATDIKDVLSPYELARLKESL